MLLLCCFRLNLNLPERFGNAWKQRLEAGVYIGNAVRLIIIQLGFAYLAFSFPYFCVSNVLSG
jgi:hypothetical protein